MSQVNRKFMRMMVFFDLPVSTREQRRAYRLFRTFLLRDGYDMMQFSVYSRIINGVDDFHKHLKRLNRNLPAEGSIRCLQVSEKQFSEMRLLVGTATVQEKTVTAQQITLF